MRLLNAFIYEPFFFFFLSLAPSPFALKFSSFIYAFIIDINYPKPSCKNNNERRTILREYKVIFYIADRRMVSLTAAPSTTPFASLWESDHRYLIIRLLAMYR